MKLASAVAIILALSVGRVGRDAAADPFEQGRVHLSLGGGTVRYMDDQYFSLGLGIGVFVLDGWELGLNADTWLGGNPAVAKLSPMTRFIFYMVPHLQPYLGIFYKHWFIGSNEPDLDTLGGQLGVMVIVGGSLLVGVGVAHEAIVSACDEDCSDTYPEFHISLAF